MEALRFEAEQIQRLVRGDLAEIGYMSFERWRHIAEVYAELGLMPRSFDLGGFLFRARQPLPWKDVLLIVGPLGTVALLCLVVAFYHRRMRRLQNESMHELQAYERKLSTLLYNMPGIAYRCHNDGKDWVMEYVSQGAYELTGYTREDLEGDSSPVYGDLIHPDDQESVGRLVMEATQKRERFRIQYRIRHKNGSWIWVWEQGMLADSETGNGGMLEGFICDVSDQKRLEAEKDHAIENLEHAMKEIKRLQGIIPICSCCKKIRNDRGGWEQLEAYIHEHSEANFSHGLCPECCRQLYPNFQSSKKDAPPPDET